MPMTAFLLQDIPADVAEYASRVARSSRRDINAVLVEMLARAAAAPVMVAATAAVPAPNPIASSAPTAATTSTPTATAAATLAGDGSSESLALLEAMQAAQSIPSG